MAMGIGVTMAQSNNAMPVCSFIQNIHISKQGIARVLAPSALLSLMFQSLNAFSITV